MKAAYLFLEKYPNYEQAFSAINKFAEDELSSLETYVFAGKWLICDLFKTKAQLQSGMENLFNPAHPGVILLAKPDLTPLVIGSTYVVQFDTIERSLASKLHDRLRSDESYFAMVEVAPEVPIHRALFSGYGPLAMIHDRKVFVLYDDNDEGDAEIAREKLESLKSLTSRFLDAELSDVNLRWSVFDPRATLTRNLDVQKSVRRLTDEFEVNTEREFYKLNDVSPDALQALEAAISKMSDYSWTAEDCSHIALSCRRCLDKATDMLEPAKNRDEQDKYKDRLTRYVQTRFAHTKPFRQYVESEIAELDTRIKKLYNMGNAGVHEDWHRRAFATVIMRVVLLLDDLLSPLAPAKPITIIPPDLFKQSGSDAGKS